MSLKPKRRKCRCCNKFFFLDYRNHDRQHYCGKPTCRRASKLASQRRWFRKPANRDYFRGPENVRRVQAWRQAHPGYWKKKSPTSENTQAAPPQPVNVRQSSCNARPSPLCTLQDSCLAKNPGFIGLIAMISGLTLPEDIVITAGLVIEQGLNILGSTVPRLTQRNAKPCPVYDRQTSAPRGSAAANPPKL